MLNPSPTAKNAISSMNTSAGARPMSEIFTPRIALAIRIIKPWINATVDPPKVLPTTIEILLTGATSTSFRNPNCLSQMTEMPANIDEKTTDMAIIPGARKSRYPNLLDNPGKVIDLRPRPRNARKKNG